MRKLLPVIVGGLAAISFSAFAIDTTQDKSATGAQAPAAASGSANVDSTKFLPEADVAKVKAIALYQAALATDSTSRVARGGRLALDRLVSGQPVHYARFFCLASE